MAPRQPLNDEQRRLLRITARMPLASVNSLASVMGATEDQVRGMMGRLGSGGWVSSVVLGITERGRHRGFLTSKAGTNPTSLAAGAKAPGRRPASPGSPSFTRKERCPRTSRSASPCITTIQST